MSHVDFKNGTDSQLLVVADEVAKWVDKQTQAAVARGEAILAQPAGRVLSQLQHGQSVVAFIGSEVVGYITTYFLIATDGLKWYEVGTAFVDLQYRGQGIGHELFRRVAEKHPEGMLLVTTKNPVAQHLCIETGFSFADYRIVPPAVRQGLCYTAPCYRAFDRSTSCSSECRLGGSCGLYVRYTQIA